MITLMGLRYKRISAYLLDMLLVAFLAVMLASNKFTNPYYNSSAKTTSEYNQAVNNLIVEMNTNNELSVKDVTDILARPLLKYERSNIFLYIWLVIFIFLYFVLFQFYNKGSTIFKQLFKIRVVDENKKKITFKRLFIRYLICGENLLLYGAPALVVVRIILLVTLNNHPVIFFYTYMAVAIITFIVTITELVTLIKGKPLHDKIAHTEVISV